MAALAEPVVPSVFAERFLYARARQHGLGTWQEDQALADALGVVKSQVTAYKKRRVAPPTERTLVIAGWCGVDPGWLAFGADTAAPAPVGFVEWLAAYRAKPKKAKTRRHREKKQAAAKVDGGTGRGKVAGSIGRKGK